MGRFIRVFLTANLVYFGWGISWSESQSESIKMEKTMSDYWSGTGLNKSVLNKIIKDETCYSTDTLFLSCVTAVNGAFEHLHKKLNFAGQVVYLSNDELKTPKTQKEMVSSWSARRARSHFSFEKILNARKLTSAQVAQAVNGFLSIYKDPHTYIIPLKYYDEVMSKSQSRLNSLGIVIRKLNSQVVVKKVYANSAVALSGIKAGDQITAINGKEVDLLLQSEVNDLLSTQINRKTVIEVISNGAKKKVTIADSDLKIYPNISSQMIDEKKGIALIAINKFSKGLCDDIKKKVTFLKQSGVRGLVLDLRDNPGGQVEEAACVINVFEPKGTLMFMMKFLDQQKRDDRYVAQDQPLFNGPLAILINSGSASSAEIVAGSLKDKGRAVLIGEKSFGKGSFQDGLVWGENAKVAMFQTDGLYYFASGWTPQGEGIEPDIKVPFHLSEPRESELFYNTLKPANSWPITTGYVGFLQNMNCYENMYDTSGSDDPQVNKAHTWIACNGEGSHGRNGSL